MEEEPDKKLEALQIPLIDVDDDEQQNVLEDENLDIVAKHRSLAVDDDFEEDVFHMSIMGFDTQRVPELGRTKSLSMHSGIPSHSVRSASSVVLPKIFPGISSVTASTFTFTNFAIQPANPANLPIACLNSGLAVFPFLICLFAAINWFTCNLLAEAIAMVGHSHAVGFAELLSNRFGRQGWYAGALAVIFANFGSLVFTLIMIGDMITPLVGLGRGERSNILCSKWLWIVVVSVFVLTPMSFIQNMSRLDLASKVAVSILFVFVFSMIGYAINLAIHPHERHSFGDSTFTDQCTQREHFHPPGHVYRAGPDSVQFLAAITNLLFSFNVQANVFPLYGELRRRSARRMKKVNRNTMITTGVIFMLAGVSGYVAFLDSTKGNSLKNFPSKGDFGYFMDVVRFLLALGLISSYPLTLWECRSHLEQMAASDDDTEGMQAAKRFAMSVLLITLSTVVACTATDVSVIFGFFGATACPTLMLLLPTLNHLKMHRRDVTQLHFIGLGRINWVDWKDSCAILILFGSIAIIPLGLYAWAVSI
eukprot:m.8288 g.8288  ORF g.8288 m.8288 type:complete len:536 (+) comp3865_c0_seq1:242-1849(+)